MFFFVFPMSLTCHELFSWNPKLFLLVFPLPPFGLEVTKVVYIMDERIHFYFGRGLIQAETALCLSLIDRFQRELQLYRHRHCGDCEHVVKFIASPVVWYWMMFDRCRLNDLRLNTDTVRDTFSCEKKINQNKESINSQGFYIIIRIINVNILNYLLAFFHTFAAVL